MRGTNPDLKGPKYGCRWCSRTSPNAQGMSAHERSAHKNAWILAHARGEKSVLGDAPNAPQAKKQMVNGAAKIHKAEVITQEPPQVEVGISADAGADSASAIKHVIMALRLRTDLLNRKIADMQMYVDERDRLDKEIEVLCQTQSEIERLRCDQSGDAWSIIDADPEAEELESGVGPT